MVDKDLQEVFDADNLFGAELQMLVFLPLEVLSMSRVENHGLNNPEGNFTDILHRDCLVVILAPIDGRECDSIRLLLLLFTLFEQLGPVHL